MWSLSQLAKLYVAMAAFCFVSDLQPLLLSQPHIATLCHLPTKLAQFICSNHWMETHSIRIFLLYLANIQKICFTFTCKPGKCLLLMHFCPSLMLDLAARLLLTIVMELIAPRFLPRGYFKWITLQNRKHRISKEIKQNCVCDLDHWPRDCFWRQRTWFTDDHHGGVRIHTLSS